MKIGIITPHAEYPGGVESVTALLSRALTENGYETSILAADQIPLNSFDRTKKRFLGEPFAVSPFMQEQAKRFDLILCNGEYGYGIQHPKCITIFHGSAYGYRKALSPYLGIRSRLQLLRTEYLQRKAAKGKTVVCVSQFLRTLYQKQAIPVNQVIPNCIDSRHFQAADGAGKKDRYLFVGNYDYYGKGFDILQKLAKRGMSIDCVTGSDPGPGIGWLRQVPNGKMPDIYSQYKIFVFPSRFEGMSMAPLEAMSCGLPVVISSVGLGETLKEYLPEFVADENIPEAYEKKTRIIEQNYAMYSRKARQYIEEHHTLAHFSQNWGALIRSLTHA